MTTCLLKGPVLVTDGLKCIELFMLPEEVEEMKVNILNGEHTKNKQKSCAGPLKMHLMPYSESSTFKRVFVQY